MTALDQNEMFALAGPNPSQSTGAPAQDPLSFGALLMVLRRRYRLFLVILLSSVAASLLAATFLPVQYTAEASLMIDPRPRSSPIRAEATRNVPAPDATLVDTEVQVMGSPAVLREVIDRLRLMKDPEFAPRPDQPPGIEAVAENLAKKVSVGRKGLTYIVAIRARSSDPDKAAAIANVVADEYLRQSKSRRSRLASDQARTLEAELGPLGQQVIAADQQIADFRAEHGIVSGGKAGASGTITDQKIESITAELGRAEADAAAANAAASTARAQVRTVGVDAISQVLNSTALTELRNQRAQVLREQAQIATVYSAEHPAYVRINKQLGELDGEIKAAANRVVMGLENDARAANARVGTLRGQLAALEARQSLDAKSTVVADGLQRNADAKRSTFNDLSRNAQEQAQEARIGDVRAWQVAAAASPLEPSFPKKSLFLMLGLIAGAGLGAGAVMGAELVESGFRSAADIEAELRVPFIAAVPEVRGPRRRIGRGRPSESPSQWDYVVDKPASAFAESIRNIRATLLAGGIGPKPTAVCVTSAVPREGKSVTAVALARVMAMSGDRVLLVDCDLRRSGLSPLRRAAPHTGEEPSTDLVEVLEGGSDPHAAIVQDVVPGLTFLGLDGPVFTARDIFSGRRARDLMDRLKAEYDFIILDAPPVLAVTDAWTISSICDTTLLVVRHSKTPREAVRAAAARLRRRGARLHGVVLNRRPHTRSLSAAGYYGSVYANHFRD